MNNLCTLKTAGRRGHTVSAALAAMAVLAMGAVGLALGAGAAAAPAAVASTASDSSYLAGYQVAPTGGLASASVTFKVPAITCTSADDSAGAEVFLGVSIDNGTSDPANGAFVLPYCSTTGPAYYYAVQTPAGIIDAPGPAAGDTVVTSLFESGSATYAEVHDLTSGASWHADDATNVGGTTIDEGSLIQSPEYPVPTFTEIDFKHATVNGDYLGFDSPTQYNLLFEGAVLIKSEALTTTGGGSKFALKFENAS